MKWLTYEPQNVMLKSMEVQVITTHLVEIHSTAIFKGLEVKKLTMLQIINVGYE